MIYEICLYGIKIKDYTEYIEVDKCNDGESETSPPNTCLIECDADQFRDPDTNECLDCRDDCTEGCMEASHCNVCTDPRCDDCPDWVNCEQCIENAEFRPEPLCFCKENFTYDNDSNTCSECHPWCQECHDADNLSCDVCAPGYYLQPGTTICLQNCPTGYENDDENRTCIGTPPTEISCAKFDKVECYDWDYNPEEPTEFLVNYFGGASSVAREGDEPVAIYLRGLWFDGVDDFLTVTGPGGFMLNVSFTIEVWIRLNNQNNFFTSYNYEMSAGQKLQFTGSGLKLQFIDRDAEETVEEDEGSLIEGQWMNIAVTAEWQQEHKRTHVSLYTNTVLQKNRNLNNYAIEDSSDYEHFIGVDRDDNKDFANFFQGFIYSFCINQYTKKVEEGVSTDFTDFEAGLCSGNFVASVTPVTVDGPVCLIECNYNQLLEADVCQICIDECSEGCRNRQNCNVCEDQLCGDCSCQHFNNGCTTCIDSAEFNDQGLCECIENYAYNADFHACTLSCDSSCVICDGPSDEECSVCADNFFLQPGSTICKPTCPSGSIKNTADNTCELVDDYEACITFDKLRYHRIAAGDSDI